MRLSHKFTLPFNDVLAADVGPEPVATLVFNAEDGAKVTYSWKTDVFKSYNGKEQRRSRRDLPQQTYAGSALLLGAEIRADRSLLAKWAAAGSVFLLGLPWEEMSLVADAVGPTLYVGSTARADWAKLGQRVVIIGRDGTMFDTKINAVHATSIDVAVDVTAIGAAGGRIMPGMPVLLDPQQGFARYRPRDVAERWQLTAHAAAAGFAGTPAVAARLALADPVTVGPETQGVVIVARAGGTTPVTIQITDDALTSGGEISEDVGAGTTHLKYAGDLTTMGEFAALFGSSELVGITGTFTSSDVMAAAEDVVPPTALAGGVDAGPPVMGTGIADLPTYQDRPIFDRGIAVDDTAGDSIHALSEILDMDGLLVAASAAQVSDWGREVTIWQSAFSDDWQWLKKFLGTVRGSCRAFWLPSGRSDLTLAP